MPRWLETSSMKEQKKVKTQKLEMSAASLAAFYMTNWDLSQMWKIANKVLFATAFYHMNTFPNGESKCEQIWHGIWEVNLRRSFASLHRNAYINSSGIHVPLVDTEAWAIHDTSGESLLIPRARGEALPIHSRVLPVLDHLRLCKASLS